MKDKLEIFLEIQVKYIMLNDFIMSKNAKYKTLKPLKYKIQNIGNILYMEFLCVLMIVNVYKNYIYLKLQINKKF